MALQYLLDEHLLGPLWSAIQRFNLGTVGHTEPLEVLRVGDVDGPPLGTNDSDILIWAERAERVLVTLDEHTLPQHLANHLQSGRHSPGVFTIRPGQRLPEIVEFLALAAVVSEPSEWADRITYIP